MGYFESIYDIFLPKLRELGCLDLRVGLGFFPLGEIIDGYQDELPLTRC